ncbi:pyruvate kinase 1, cytosolic-like protein, partial [Tanacetum coccineum]
MRGYPVPNPFPGQPQHVYQGGLVVKHPDVLRKVARFDFTWGDAAFHQETLENLKIAIKKTKKLCAVMLDTTGPELLVVNKSDHPIPLEADSLVVLTPDQEKEASSNLLPINFNGLAKAVKSGDTIF